MNDSIFPAATLALAQTVGAFQWLLPKLADVRRADTAVDKETVQDVRAGELAAVALNVGVGAVLAKLTNTAAPLVVSLFTAAVIIGVYEYTLRKA